MQASAVIFTRLFLHQGFSKEKKEPKLLVIGSFPVMRSLGFMLVQQKKSPAKAMKTLAGDAV